MANEQTYLVELSPLGNYYFGSENTFRTADKATNEGDITNYLVRSRKYPQQSALLGMLRYVILLKENALHKSSCEKEKLIGEFSFKGEEKDAPTSWGRIEKISPLFMRSNNQNFVVAGLDEHCERKGKEGRGQLSIESQDGIAYFRDYDAKKPMELAWKNAEKTDEYVKEMCIFQEVFQVGITKSFKGESEDDAYYKQFFYKLKNDFCFAFYVTFNEKVANIEKEIIANIGADQSLFNIRFTLISVKNPQFQGVTFENTLPEKKGKMKIILQSDAYCAPSILDNCFLNISNSIDFRYIKTSVHTKRYYNLSKKEDDMQKSEKLNLLERGSVLFAENEQKANAIISELIKYTAYRSIGFNQFLIKPLS